MNHASNDPGSPRLDAAQTSQFLRMALVGNRPVDRLVERLRRPDGARWFEQLIEARPVATLSMPPHEGLLRGGASLADLAGLKEAGKAFYAEVSDRDERLRGAGAYFLVVAAALVHHRQRITSQSQQDLDPIFFELSEVCPPPWNDFFAQAAVVASELD